MALLIFVIGFASKKIMLIFTGKGKSELPTSIKIGGFTYSIKEVEGLADNGSTDFDSQSILIRKSMTTERKVSALLHEIIEIWNELGDLDLKHQTIQTLEAFLFQTIVDN